MAVILGISSFYHDSAASLLVDGKIVAAVQEERFSRKKNDADFPKHSILYCLKESGLRWDQIDLVVFYEKPFLKFERLLETYLAMAPRGVRSFAKALPLWIKEKLFQKDNLISELRTLSGQKNWSNRILFSEHHLSHAASAFFPSPFRNAVVLTMDGVGEWATSTIGVGSENCLKIIQEMHFPHSLGLLYSAFTYHLGFKVNSGEYKMMGLAPYGKPVFKDLILKNLVDLKEDGSFRLNLEYFDYCTGLSMTNKSFSRLFDLVPRLPDQELCQKHMDIAASIQQVLEEIVVRMAKHAKQLTGAENLCLAGGVALNCVANGKLVQERLFKKIWIQPAAGDAGGSMGAALAAHYLYCGSSRAPNDSGEDQMNGSYLGPEYTEEEIQSYLISCGANFEKLPWDNLYAKVCTDLECGKAVGWFQGRMEFGPRALGARSIIADARNANTQRNLNLKVKYRESFRPFAPAVTEENVSSWFDWEGPSPYMLIVSKVKNTFAAETAAGPPKTIIEHLNQPRSKIPAVTHVDYSARIQTVSAKTNPRFHKLLSEFGRRTGVPILVNTSFNIRGEPIVCDPKDAFMCFMGTEIESLVIENFYLEKSKQNKKFQIDYKEKFDLD